MIATHSSSATYRSKGSQHLKRDSGQTPNVMNYWQQLEGCGIGPRRTGPSSPRSFLSLRPGDSLELFGLAANFGEQGNLADRPEHRFLRDSFATPLRRWRQDAVPAKR